MSSVVFYSVEVGKKPVELFLRLTVKTKERRKPGSKIWRNKGRLKTRARYYALSSSGGNPEYPRQPVAVISGWPGNGEERQDSWMNLACWKPGSDTDQIWWPWASKARSSGTLHCAERMFFPPSTRECWMTPSHPEDDSSPLYSTAWQSVRQIRGWGGHQGLVWSGKAVTRISDVLHDFVILLITISGVAVLCASGKLPFSRG